MSLNLFGDARHQIEHIEEYEDTQHTSGEWIRWARSVTDIQWSGPVSRGGNRNSCGKSCNKTRTKGYQGIVDDYYHRHIKRSQNNQFNHLVLSRPVLDHVPMNFFLVTEANDLIFRDDKLL